MRPSLLLLAPLVGCHSPVGAGTPSAGAQAGVVEAYLDRAAPPCDDFYQFACGGWLKATEIPADRPAWSRIDELVERNLTTLRGILEKDAAAGGIPPASGSQGGLPPDEAYAPKLGDFYATCMDEAKAETASLAHLKERLASLDGIGDAAALPKAVAALHDVGVGALFVFTSEQDFKDASRVIGEADQGGLGLPDRDYYFAGDARSVAIRGLYLDHVGRMLQLAGEASADADAHARTVLAVETTLAKASLRRVERRDPARIYHRLDRDGLQALTPHFGWSGYFQALGHPDVGAINVRVPDFFVAVDGLVASAPIADLRTYLRWQLLHAAAPALGKVFVDEDFHFRSSALSGEKELAPRWKRCVRATDTALGEALGQPFVKLRFGEDGKRRAGSMIATVEGAFGDDLASLAWMDPATRAAASEKLARMVNKIGYPDRWRNYDALVADRSSYLANRLRAARFEVHRQLDKIGKPVDRGEWQMSPPTVNAYYEALLNEMVFPAGILQPPFFGRAAADAANYGAIGMVMGHELTHGFDDKGRKFDANGNLRDWWDPATARAFEQKAECVARQYDGYVAVDGLHLDGHLTLGENIADLGGLKLALAAEPKGRTAPVEPGPSSRARGGLSPAKVAGFDERQQLFLSFAQAWCTNRRDAYSRMLVTVDTHSPPRYRVNGVVRNLPEFARAFACSDGSPMAPRDRCGVW